MRGRRPISQEIMKPDQKSGLEIRRDSGPTPVARGGCGAKNEVRSQKREKKKGKKKQTQVKETKKGQYPRNSGPTPVVHGGSGAKAPPLAARPRHE